MRKLIECIPNFSEGRDLKVIDGIAAVVEACGVKLLHRTSDYDHNRSVLTFAGSPESVLEAAFRVTEKAAELIDMSKHEGVHPCIGATDVLPLVPLQGVSWEECIGYAEGLGKRIGNELGIPVYLYEKAARDERLEDLANLRKLVWAGDIEPDFGFSKSTGNMVGSAGSMALGVRKFLIAFNVNLKSKDLAVAKKIAGKIRERSGGLPAVKALGLELEEYGCVQVSMNLVDYKQTGIYEVFDAISKESGALGVEVLESELIGMIPEEALGNDYERLKIRDFSMRQVLRLDSL